MEWVTRSSRVTTVESIQCPVADFVVVAGPDPATHAVSARQVERPMEWVTRSSRVTTTERCSKPCPFSFVVAGPDPATHAVTARQGEGPVEPGDDE
jgi:hypothetical protein